VPPDFSIFVPCFSLLLVGLLVALLAAHLKIRRVQKGLKERDDRYRTVADFTYDWEYWEAPDGTLIYTSPSCKRITGYTADELTSYPYHLDKMILEEDRMAWQEHRKEEESGEAETIQFRITRKDGTVRWIEHVCCRVFGKDGAFLGYRGSNRDITDLKNAERAAWLQKENVARENRTASMGHLTASIAHELNQPLTGILSNAQASEMLIDRGECNCEDMKEIMKDVISDAKRAGDIIRNLRDLYREQKSDFQKLSLNTILRETLEILHGEFVLQNIELVTRLTDPLPMVNGNKVQIEQVLINLIMNGQQAMSELPGEQRVLTITTGHDLARGVCLWVDDNGPGIDPDRIHQIFEPLVTWKPGGTGMGLAISHSIIESHHGKMWAENRPDGGARVGFSLDALEKES